MNEVLYLLNELFFPA